MCCSCNDYKTIYSQQSIIKYIIFHNMTKLSRTGSFHAKRKSTHSLRIVLK